MPTSYSPDTTTCAADRAASRSPLRTFRCRIRLPSGRRCGVLAAVLDDRRGLRVQVGHRPARAVAEGVARVGDRLEHLVVDGDPRAGPSRRLGMVGRDQRDRLALVEHGAPGEHRLVGDLQPVEQLARHVVGGQHREDAGHSQGRADVQRPDAGVRVRAAQRDAPQHVVHPEVAAVGELAGHLQRPVGTRRVGADPAVGAGRRAGGCAGCRARRRRHDAALASRVRAAVSTSRASRVLVDGDQPAVLDDDPPADEQQLERRR